MTNFQKCILIFIGEFLVLTGCLVVAIGSPPDIGRMSLDPHYLAVCAMIVAAISLLISLRAVYKMAASSPSPILRRLLFIPPPPEKEKTSEQKQ